MKIRVINENDWERTYELDKSIIRVGSQLSCDIQLSGKDIQPIQMQIVRSGGKEIKYILRIFADNVKISRGEQIFTGQQMVPYDVLDGDKFIFGEYRMTLSLDDEQTRIRSSKNMEAKMYIQKRDLAVDSPINGVLRLKNIGTEKACQFRLQIRGIPDECLTTAPLPYLYPGGKSTVGFMISHLQTKPAPGFHTVSIVLSAPDDYFGEILEFRQDIYVNPVFKNEIILEDDSAELSGFNKAQSTETKQQEEPEQQPAVSHIQETARMIPGQAVIEKEDRKTDAEKEPVVISGADNKNAFAEENDEEENGPRRRRSGKKQKVNVIRHDDDAFKDYFEDEDEPEENVMPEETLESPGEAEEQAPAEDPASPEKTEAPAGPEEAPVRSKKKQKVNVIRHDAEAFTDDPGDEEEPEKTVIAAESSESSEKAEEPAPAEVPVPPEKTETSAEPAEEPEKAKKSPGRKKKTVPAEEPEKAPAESEPVIIREPEKQAAEPEVRNKPKKQPKVNKEEQPEMAAVSEPAEVSETPEDKPEFVPADEHYAAEEVSGPMPVNEPELPEAEPMKPAEPEAKNEPEAEERPEIPQEKLPAWESVTEPADEPEPAEEKAEPEEIDADTEIFTMRPAEETEQPAEGSGQQSEPATFEEQPDMPEEILRDTEQASGSVEGPEKPAEEKSAGKANKENVITGSGKAPIPVVHHNDSFDFAEEDEPPVPVSAEEPEVRFVKRGSFDE